MFKVVTTDGTVLFEHIKSSQAAEHFADWGKSRGFTVKIEEEKE